MSQPAKFRLSIGQALLLAWVMCSILFYIVISLTSYVHSFTFDNPGEWLEAAQRIEARAYLLDLFLASLGILAFGLACLTLGLVLLDLLNLGNAGPLPSGVTGFLLGEIALSAFFLTATGLRSLSPTLIWSCLAVIFVIGFPALKRYGQSIPTSTQPQPFAKSERIIFALVLVAFFSALLLASSRLGYDAVAEYFSNAKFIAASGQPDLLYPLQNFAVSALHSSILFSSIIQTFGDHSARMLTWVNGITIALMGAALAAKCGFLTRTRIYFAALLATSTAFIDLLGDGKVEIISTAPIIAALWWMLDSLQNPSGKRFLLIGALLGFAIIARPYNVFLVPVFTLSFYLLRVIDHWRHEGPASTWKFTRQALWMLPTLLAMGIFHLWQNHLWLGSPFAPLTYARQLDSGDWQWQFDPAILNVVRLFYPFTASFFNTPQSLGNVSPLLIGFLPYLFLKQIKTNLGLPQGLRQLLAPALATLALWLIFFFTVVEIRYVFFLWILFFIFGARVMQTALEKLQPLSRKLAKTSLLILLAFISLRAGILSIATYSPVDSRGQAHCYDIGFCDMLEPVNQAAAAGERVLVLNPYRYYLRPDLFACSSQAMEYAPIQKVQETSLFWQEAYRQGYRYVLYDKYFSETHSQFGKIPSPNLAPGWLKITILHTSSTGRRIAYRLDAISPPFEAQKSCKFDGKTWKVVSSP
jgi:hypothetical protein